MIGKVKIAVVGLGYVGLPLAIEFSKKFSTVGYDIDKNRIKDLINGNDKTLEVSSDELLETQLSFSTKLNDIADCNVYIVTVPTPVDQYNKPDMQPILKASTIIGEVLKKDDIVIYESTVYPGATEEYCVPILEKRSKLKFNLDFFCGYSPERINPGDSKNSLTLIKKITSGSNKNTSKFVDELYNTIITAGTHKAPSIKVAEAAKVIENIQRDVNIALINELSIIFNKLNLDTIDILEAAGTKWNFIPFRPGLVGGHCIGVDPYYLTYKAMEIGYHPEIILAGRRINDGMGKYIADHAIAELSKLSIDSFKAKIAICGLTFKEDCPDLRNTKVISILDNLYNYKSNIKVTDPIANKEEAKTFYGIDLVNFKELKDINIIILAVAHDQYAQTKKEEWLGLFSGSGVFIDVKGVVNKEYFKNTDITYWRL